MGCERAHGPGAAGSAARSGVWRSLAEHVSFETRACVIGPAELGTCGAVPVATGIVIQSVSYVVLVADALL